jgi:hypothetical protein
VHKSAPANRRTHRSQPYRITEPATVIKVRFNEAVVGSAGQGEVADKSLIGPWVRTACRKHRLGQSQYRASL